MSLFRNVVTVGSMRIILTGIIFSSDLVISRYLGVSLKGEFFFLATSLLLLGTLFTAGLHLGNIYYSKFIPFSNLLANSLVYLGALGIILVAAAVPWASHIPVVAGKGLAFKAILLTCLVMEAAGIIALSFFVAYDQLDIYAQIRILRRGLFLCFLFLAWMIWEPSLELVFKFYLIALLVSIIVAGLRLPRLDAPFRWQWSSLRKCLSYGMRSQALVSVDLGTQRFNAILVGIWASPVQNGLYSVALNFGQALWLLAGVMSTVIQSSVSLSREEQVSQLGKLCRYSIALMILGGTALALLAKPLIRLGYGQAFANAAPLVIVMLPGFVAYALYSLAGSFMIINGRAGTALVASLAGLGINVLLGVLLIPTQGAQGAAIALCWGYLTSTVLMLILLSSIFDVRLRSLLILQKSDVRDLIAKVIKYYPHKGL